MGEIMKLIEIVHLIEQQDNAKTIYATTPWTQESLAIAATEPDDGDLPLEVKELGAIYFLEVFLAKEFISGWLSNIGYTPSAKEICDRLIQYAETDA